MYTNQWSVFGHNNNKWKYIIFATIIEEKDEEETDDEQPPQGTAKFYIRKTLSNEDRANRKQRTETP